MRRRTGGRRSRRGQQRRRRGRTRRHNGVDREICQSMCVVIQKINDLMYSGFLIGYTCVTSYKDTLRRRRYRLFICDNEFALLTARHVKSSILCEYKSIQGTRYYLKWFESRCIIQTIQNSGCKSRMEERQNIYAQLRHPFSLFTRKNFSSHHVSI